MADYTKIQSSQYFLFVDPLGGTAYSQIVCLTSHNFNSSTAVNDAGSMCGPDQVAGDTTANISLDGQVVLDPGASEMAAGEIFDLHAAKTTVGWKIGRGVPVAGDLTKSGTGFFSAYTETSNKDNVTSFTATLSIKGEVTQVVETGS